MIKIPRKITQTIITKDGKTKTKHLILEKIYPQIVTYKWIEVGLLESFSKNDFFTKEDIKDEQTNKTDSI